MAKLRSLRCCFILVVLGFASMLLLYLSMYQSTLSFSELSGLNRVDRVGRFVYEKALRKAVIPSCNTQRSRRYLSDLCKSYHEGEITGSMCKPLCDSQDIFYLNCIPGGNDKTMVILALWEKKRIVLKARKLTSDIGQSESLNIDDFRKKALVLIQGTIGIYGHKSIQVLDWIVRECDVGGNSILSGAELVHCSKLIQPDLILHTLLNSTLVPEIYGSCGELLAVEFASTKDLYASIFDKRPWTKRVELAIAVLHYIQRLEHTPYGTLYLCDIQWKNLGVVKGFDGNTIIKSIDNDKSYFGIVAERMLNKSRPCTQDHDCRLVGCSVECNLTTHICSRQLSSNNLQLVCKSIFWSNFNRYLPALLSNPPTWISRKLDSLMADCLKSGKTNQHIPQELIDQFHFLLWQSLS